jgi:integrase
MFCIAAYTGMRRGEIVTRLRWLDVNFAATTITARSRKQSRQEEETSRDIAMHPELEEILKAYQAKRPKGQYVICPADTLLPLSIHTAYGHFQRTLEGTPWERELPSGTKKIIIGFHTFRHSFASNLAMQGVDQRLIDKMMGHQTEEMRKRYQHLGRNKLADAIRNLSFNGNGNQQPSTQTGISAE